MKLLVQKGKTSFLASVFIQDSSSTVGAGLSGLVFNTSGLVCYRARADDGNAGGTAVSLATATLGTWATGGFKEKDATNMKGVYEIGITNASLATGSDYCILYFAGATNMAPLVLEIQLVAFDPDDAVHLGLSSLPNTAVTTNASLLTSGTGTDQLSVTSGRIDVGKLLGTAWLAPGTAGTPDVNAKLIGGTAQTGRDIGASVLLSSGSGTGQVLLSSGHISNVDTLTTYTGNTVQTGDAFARLGAPAGASVSADVAAIKSDTGTILTDVNTGAGAIYTRLGAPAGASIAADIAAVKSDSGTTLTDAIAIKAQTDKLAFTVTNQVDANALSINGNATAASNVAHTNQALTRGTVGAASSTTSIICSAIASPASVGASGQFIGRTILFDADTATTNLQGQATNITANTTGATPTFTCTALTTAPVSGDKFSIV